MKILQTLSLKQLFFSDDVTSTFIFQFVPSHHLAVLLFMIQSIPDGYNHPNLLLFSFNVFLTQKYFFSFISSGWEWLFMLVLKGTDLLRGTEHHLFLLMGWLHFIFVDFFWRTRNYNWMIASFCIWVRVSWETLLVFVGIFCFSSF